jgi:hypothetical protein
MPRYLFEVYEDGDLVMYHLEHKYGGGTYSWMTKWVKIPWGT